MPSPSLAGSLRASVPVCKACRISLRTAPLPRQHAVRNLSTASSQAPRTIAPRIISSNPPLFKPSGRQYRSYSTPKATPNAQLSAPYPGEVNPGVTRLTHRGLLSLTGQDAAKFLNGLITNRVDESRTSPFYAAFLDSRGRILSDVFVWPRAGVDDSHGVGNWACYIEVDASEMDSLKKHMRKHKLRSKIEVNEVDANELAVWSAWGAEVRNGLDGDTPWMFDPRAPKEALCRFLAPSAEGASKVPTLPEKGLEDYTQLRYTYGIAEGPAEMERASALPMEYNIDLAGGIDFKKGCYVGQELTIRTKHTGVVRKRLLPIKMARPIGPDYQPENGRIIKALDVDGSFKKGRAAGKFVAGVGDTAIALCRVEHMTSMRVSAEGGTWTPESKFGLQPYEENNESVVEVTPVVYNYFLVRERDLWDASRKRLFL